MSQAAADPVLDQLHPKALALITAAGIDVPGGYKTDDTGTPRQAWGPNFPGLSEHDWRQIYRYDPGAYDTLVGLCEADFPTFCVLIARVVPKGGGGAQPLIFNNSQRYVWATFAARIIAKKPLWFVILKARQLGVTTFMAAWQYWQLWRQPNVQTLMLGHNDKLSERIIGIMRVIHDHLPAIGDLKPRLRQDTAKQKARVPKAEVYLTARGERVWNSWGITGSAKNVDQRGFQGTHFSGSEAAFWPRLNMLKDALLPQLPPPGSPKYLQSSVIFESSPQGQNEFYDLYQLAKEPGSDWCAIFVPWFLQDDEYTLEPPPGWRMDDEEQEELRRLKTLRKSVDGKTITRGQMFYRHHMLLNKYDNVVEAWDTEYPADDETAFMMSEGMLFRNDAKYLHHCVLRAEVESKNALIAFGLGSAVPWRGRMAFDPMPSPFASTSYQAAGKTTLMADPKGNLLIWEPPKKGHHYVIGADASGGQAGRDGTCAEVICVTCGKQAAELYDHIGPEDFADHLAHLGHLYNDALLNPEVNFMGSTVLKRVMQLWNYPNVALEEKWDEIRLKRGKYGFCTTAHNKPILIANMVAMIKNRHYAISGRDLNRELSTFYHTGWTAFGGETYGGGTTGRRHDDRVIATALALIAVRQSPKMYVDMTMHQFAVPSAVEIGLNKTPQPEIVGKMSTEFPVQLRNIFESIGETQLTPTWNPMRP